jgi:hypothetical protein
VGWGAQCGRGRGKGMAPEAAKGGSRASRSSAPREARIPRKQSRSPAPPSGPKVQVASGRDLLLPPSPSTPPPVPSLPRPAPGAPPSRACRIGTPTSQDALVYEEADEAFYVGIGRDSSDEVLYIHAGEPRTGPPAARGWRRAARARGAVFGMGVSGAQPRNPGPGGALVGASGPSWCLGPHSMACFRKGRSRTAGGPFPRPRSPAPALRPRLPGPTCASPPPRAHPLPLARDAPGSAVTSETRYLAADDPEGEFKVVLPRAQVRGPHLRSAASRRAAARALSQARGARLGGGAPPEGASGVARARCWHVVGCAAGPPALLAARQLRF